MSMQQTLLRDHRERKPMAANGHTKHMVHEARPSQHWETEVVVLRGDDRDHLCQRALALADYLKGHAGVVLKDLAFSINAELPEGGSRLAVVAGSVEELQARLRSARERLADPRCRQLRDSQGVYFVEKPLAPEGRLAVLFPGEGAQYVNMLVDLLPNFPASRAHFEVCDRLLVQGGHRQQPLSRAIFPPPKATPEELAAAEQELWQFNEAVASVLIAEWALYQVLLQLGIRADAIAGHSSGEFSALAAAGCLEVNELWFERLLGMITVLQQRQETGVQVPEGILLAVGTGRRTVEEIVGRLGVASAAGVSSAGAGQPQPAEGGAPTGVYVAMDNCPHQVILAGLPEAMAPVEAQLRARGIVCERLPFNRPYHTPLFEPVLDPLVKMYAGAPVHSPHTPIYSCVTGRPFPADPDAIRSLAVTHWASSVEFRRIIESMYADGVRIFIETGPRGNLTSFVEDILRGRPNLAVTADLQRRSSVTQLNHLAGQLAAHQVPLRLEQLYAHREPQRIDWEPRPAPAPAPSVPPVPAPAGERGPLMAQYWGVMEQFLDIQREVMEQYLATRRNPAPAAPAAAVSPLTPPAESCLPRWPMLGEIVRHEPGASLVLRRRLDLTEDLYGLDHALGGRNVSAVDPSQSGLQVMPMALSIEMMAEAASVLVPGKRILGMKRVRLQRWIPFDELEPTSLELTAQVVPGEPVQVRIAIRDLGNATRPGTADSPAVEGTVLLAEQYPEPPPVEPFPLTNERPCKHTAHELYEGERRLFHGPIFQAVCSTDRHGDEGIEGQLRALPHSGLFRSTANPDLLTDPVLIDASTHLLGCWHMGEPDPNGRVVFPYELGNVEFFGPRPALGSLLRCRVRIGATTSRRISHEIDLIGPDGRYWCRIHPAEYWRFYIPKNFVDFYRRHSEYLLAAKWPLAGTETPDVCCMRVEPIPDLLQPVWRSAMAHTILTPAEWSQYRTLKGPETRLNQWVFGRVAAKDAVRVLWQQRHGERLFPADIEITADAHGRPLVQRRGSAAKEEWPAVSITHCGSVMAALAAFGRPAGIDLEKIEPRGEGFEATAFDEHERHLLDSFGDNRAEGITRLWCAKETVAKALGRGLADGPRTVVVRGVEAETGRILVALGATLADAYPELRLELLIAHTTREGDLIVATTFCERAGQ